MNNEDIIELKKYIPMDEYEGKWFFEDESIPVSEEDLQQIKPLTSQYSSYLWNKYISKNFSHLNYINTNEWSIMLPQDKYNWKKDWYENNFNSLSNYIVGKVDYKMEDIIIFFWMKEWAIETSWNIFLKHWINFLFENEAPIIINVKSMDSISFGTHGNLFIGKRKTI